MEPFDLKVDHELKIVTVYVGGKLSLEEIYTTITKARKASAENQYPLLYDLRVADPEINLAEIFNLPTNLDVLRESQTRFMRAGLLAPKGPEGEKYRFYETVVQNRGLPFRVFYEEEEAHEWLGIQSGKPE